MTATSVATSGDTSTAAALRLEGVRKTYQVGGGEVVALDCADLTVGRDEIVALVGPSGSGKTTLCSIAGGILAPTTGTVVVGGKDISGYSSRQLTEFRRQSVGFVFQTVNLVPFLTTHENLLVVDGIGPRDEMKSRGTAAVIVTHDDRITHYADRVVRSSTAASTTPPTPAPERRAGQAAAG